MKMLAAIIILAGVISSQAECGAASSFLPNSKVSVSIICPSTISTDPSFSFRLTNVGTTAVEVNQQVPISVLVHLTVRDASGNVLAPEHVNSGSRRTVEPKLLQPGDSLMLDDWLNFGQPRTTIIPISFFGYH